MAKKRKAKRKIVKRKRRSARRVRVRRRKQARRRVARRRPKPRRSKDARFERTRYAADPRFPLFSELRELVLKASPDMKTEMTKRISSLGRMKLAVISGVFLKGIGDDSSEPFEGVPDLFLVGDSVSRARLKLFLKTLEADIGTDIEYVLMDKAEFEYRYGMFDRYVRMLFEGPHEKLINKLGI